MRNAELLGIAVVALVVGCVGPPGDVGPQGPVGPAGSYARTVVVSPVGSELENGAALFAAVDGITTATNSNPFLVKIEPGLYDVSNSGLGLLFMKDFVDIEGSGEQTTVIKGINNSTVRAANAELRFLTVFNTGSGTFQTAVDTYAATTGFRMMHVTATAVSVGGMFAKGFAGNALIRDCTIRGSGATTSSGIDSNAGGQLTVIDSVVEGPDFGIRLQSGVGHAVNSQVIGGGSGVTCVNCYDAAYASLDNTCN